MINFRKLEGLPKEKRQKEISDSGILDRKRFILSKNPELKERIKKLQEVIYALKDQYTEIVSFGLVGSHTKGYATKKSDIDGYLFIDAGEALKTLDLDTLEKEHEKLKEIREEISKDIIDADAREKAMNFYAICVKYEDIIQKTLREKLSLSEEQVDHISVIPISEKIMRESVAKENFFALHFIFSLCIGSKDMQRYRKIVFDELEKEGVEGERKWQEIMQALLVEERGEITLETPEPFTTLLQYSHLYPQTLAEGRKYFLKENL